MNVWPIVFLVVLIVAYLALRKFSATAEGSAEAKPLSLKTELGWGVIALGVLIVFMPSTAARIAALDFIKSDAFAILIGSTLVLGLLVILAGLAVVLAKE